MSENRQRRAVESLRLVTMWDDDARYAVIKGRDPRYDGVFFTAVTSTRIYCRPSCPARTPARANVRFYPSAASAAEAGFRACKRCQPDSVPGSPEWSLRGDVVARAMRLIDDGVVDREGIEGLANRLGYSSRHVARLMTAELGAGPLALAIAHRLHYARVLIESTSMPIADIAHAAGFGSVRRLNEAAAARWDRTPSRLRAAKAAPVGDGIDVSLAFRGPYDAGALLAFLAARAIDGVEVVDGLSYTRAVLLPHGPALVTVRAAEAQAAHNATIAARLHLSDPRDLPAAVARLRALLDLDADPLAISEALATDPLLAPLIAKHPGLRIPGALDPFEMVVRAIVGQQISVAGARTTLGVIARTWGVTHQVNGVTWTLFPTADALADIDPSVGLIPAARWRSIGAVARALCEGSLDLGPGADRREARAALLAIPGIGPWTADYVTMRALHDPDAFLAGDLVLRKALGLSEKELLARADGWSPWRAYAAFQVWTAAAEGR